jgi:glucose-1-phosphate adenylyltransferase
MHDVLTFILGGGRGTRLYPLTRRRSEPAVPIGGKYRLIDIPISSCINSGLMRIYVLTQYSSVSLHRHISNAYKFSPFSHGFVSVLAAQQTNEAADWYQGTADALRQNLRYLHDEDYRDVLVLSGDHFYRMDFGELIRAHRERHDAVTVAVLPVERDTARHLGVVRVDPALRITELVEKPQQPEQFEALRADPAWLAKEGFAPGREYLANMGIYLFSRDALVDLLKARPQATDLVTEVLTPALASQPISAYLFRGYWEDVGTIAHYFRANLALASDESPFDFHNDEGLIYTRMRDLPASRVSGAKLTHCHISDGCVIHAGAELERCVIGVRSTIGPGVKMREVVMLGANYFDTQKQGAVPPGVGEGSVLERCILDKNCRVGRGVKILNRAGRKDADEANYVIRDGIVILPGGAVVADGTEI